MHPFGYDLSTGLLALGVIQGLTYGLLAAGFILVYRSTKVINFAHGETGAFGAAICGVVAVRYSLPFWVAFLAGMAASAAAGAATEVVAVRRLRGAPRLMTMVATLGVGSVLLGLARVINTDAGGRSFPEPSGMPTFHMGLLVVTRSYSTMLLLTPVLILVLALFLRRSRFGLALRAASDNPDRAQMVGVSVSTMSTLAWAVAGALAAFTTILILPSRGIGATESLGPVLLLRALVPATLARFSSLPVALGAGVVVGVVDQVLAYNNPTSGLAEPLLLALVLVVLLFQAPRRGRLEQPDDWARLQPWAPLTDGERSRWIVRHLGLIVGGLGLVAGVVVGRIGSNQTAVTLTAVVALALIGLSLGLLTGLGGQLSLGQFGVAAIGALVSAKVASSTGNGVLGLAAAVAIGAVVSVVIGIPALRVRGLLLAIVTLSFALTTNTWLLRQDWAFGGGLAPGRPRIGPIDLDLAKDYYLFALAALVLAVVVAGNVWRGGIGLRLRAQRDNEDGLRAFAISTTDVRLQGFLVAGGLAGLGGAVYGHLLSRLTPNTFDVLTSIDLVALAVLGGIGNLSGPILGALYIVGLPRFLPLDSAGTAASSAGWLLLILYFPGGLTQAIAGPRRALLRWLTRGVAVAGAGAPPTPGPERWQVLRPTERPGTSERARGRLEAEGGLPTPRGGRGTPALVVESVTRRYEGVLAVDRVTFEVARGEVLGIIGPNGAGKTTLFEVLSGFTRPDEGTVSLFGRSITKATPEERAQLGLIRSFQDPRLFPTLTVEETVVLAFERTRPTRPGRSFLGLQGDERRKREQARDLLGTMGLEPYRDKQVRELSTGTRRITELACIVALRPRLLLLDEPSSGIAQRESEALGGLLLRLRDHLEATFLVIEHDIPLLSSISTRMMAMDTGRLITTGTPDEVRRHPLVVESYLGADGTAIERSGRPARGRRAGVPS